MPGTTRDLEILQTVLRRTMGVPALTDLADITHEHVVMPQELPLQAARSTGAAAVGRDTAQSSAAGNRQ